MTTTKVCTVCEKELPLEDFYDQKGGKDGKRAQCKLCLSLNNNKHYWANKLAEKIRTKTPGTTKWAKRAAQGHASGKAANIIALFILDVEGKLNLENKRELAAALGVNRSTLDRYFATLERAKVIALGIIRKME